MTYVTKLPTIQFQKAHLILSHTSSIDIELTERCNNNCIHCYINQPGNDFNIQALESPTEKIMDILQQSAELGFLSVRFTGGEPLLREDFTDLYLFARRLGLGVTLFTNATLITETLCKLFTKIPPGRPISISVYGMHAHSYDAVVSRRGAYEEFSRGIKLLTEYQIPFTVKASLLPQNKLEMDEFEAFAETIHTTKDKPSYTMNFDLRARRDNPSKNKIINSLRASPEETLAVLISEKEKYLKGMRQFANKFMQPQGENLFACGAGLRTCVDAFGNSQMCMLLRHPATVYSLDKVQHQQNHPKTNLSPLAFALKVFFPKIRELKSTNPDYLNRCAQCFLKSLCGQCPGKSWEEHGTLDTPVEYLCEIAHFQAECLGLLNNKEKAWSVKPEIWKKRISRFVALDEQ